MILDKKNEWRFTIRHGETNITIPRGIFIAIAGAITLVSFLKIARTL
jgi:hypothetical protein